MKIIDIAICVDNIDPKGMGRIRCVRYNDYVGEKENSTKYEKWSQDDPFIASPFLPNNINFVPENGQSVKVLNYNTDNENINLEYVAGPFTTQFDEVIFPQKFLPKEELKDLRNQLDIKLAKLSNISKKMEIKLKRKLLAKNLAMIDINQSEGET